MRESTPAASGRPSGRGRKGFTLMACLASVGLLAPVAIGATGSALREGVRNPSRGDATAETKIIARTPANMYSTRQSNVGAGGSAIYGCRTTADPQKLADPTVSTPCLRVNNLGKGLVYSYRFSAKGVGGIYQAGLTPDADPVAKPFITNATAVATGLNADRVDGIEAKGLIASIRSAGPGGQGPKGETGDKGPIGPPGIPGVSGIDCDPNTNVQCRGAQGERGTKWFTGDGSPPAGNLAGTQQGDFYLDVAGDDRGNVYEKTSPSGWTFQLSIKGPDGPDEPVPTNLQPYIDNVVSDYCANPGQCPAPTSP